MCALDQVLQQLWEVALAAKHCLQLSLDLTNLLKANDKVATKQQAKAVDNLKLVLFGTSGWLTIVQIVQQLIRTLSATAFTR